VAQKVSKKNEILQKAGEHFSKYGYALTHLDALAADCNISKPAIYYHFKDKAALYEAVLLEKMTALSEQILAHTRTGDPVKDLENYIVTFGSFLIETPVFSAILGREIANGAEAMPQSCVTALSQTIQRLEYILHSGEEKGMFHCENPFLIQMMIVATLTSYVTAKGLRDKVSKTLDRKDNAFDPHIGDVSQNLAEKIIKALTV